MKQISLIVPVKNDFDSFIELLNSLEKQIHKPNELIIVDSSNDKKIEQYIIETKLKLEINYIKMKNKYPGEARNLGIVKAKYELVAFLDAKTIPNKYWLKNQYQNLINKNLDVIFGKTEYVSTTSFQKFIKASTFGSIGHTTTPGTLIKKSLLIKNYFIEGVRTADDLEWRERLINKNIKYDFSENIDLLYKSLPYNLVALLKRYFTYSFHTAQVNVDNKLKYFYFFLLIFFLFLIIPRWNQYLPAWNINHPLYIQNHIKFYLLLFLTIGLIIVSINNFPFFIKNRYNYLIKAFFLISSIFLVYNWNNFTAYFLEKSSLYFPHITKIYLFSIFLISFLIRGIFYPLKRKINFNYIFPFNWILIGFFGFLIDIVKAPAYLYGAILPKRLLKKNNNNISNLVFYPKYGEQSPSYRVRFLSFKNYLIKNYYKVNTKELFDEDFYKQRIFKKKYNYIKIINFYFLRIMDLILRKKPFVAIIHVELLPYVPFLAEFILNLRKIPYFIDIDDAVYFRFKNKNKILYFLDKLKFKYMVKKSTAILAGNYFHLNYLKNFNNNIYYFPTTIDFKRYNYLNYKNKHTTFTIVWIGTPSTTLYLDQITNVLNKIKKDYQINIKLIGADKNIVPNLNCLHIKWNAKTEIEELSKCHLGIMPLLDTNWELGKCAYKILQYMSLKLPVIASPVGVNKEIIENNYNGMLASNEIEWSNKIIKLINDDNLRTKISNNGYETVKKNFSLENYKSKYLNIIENAG